MLKIGPPSLECSSSTGRPAEPGRGQSKRSLRSAADRHGPPGYYANGAPASKQSAAAAHGQGSIEAPPATVLFVSDDNYFRSTMRACLEHMGLTVRSSADAARIPELFFQQPGAGTAVDLLLIDVHALGQTGFLLAAELTSFAPDLPVVIITSPGMEEGQLAGIARQGWKLLNKPVLLPQLLGVIRRALQPPLEPRPAGSRRLFPGLRSKGLCNESR